VIVGEAVLVDVTVGVCVRVAVGEGVAEGGTV